MTSGIDELGAARRPLGGLSFAASPRAVGTALFVAIAIAVYGLTPILDQRIPEVFRSIDWLAYSRAAQRFVDGGSLYAPQQLSGPYVMASVAGFGYVYPPPSVLLFVPFLALGSTAWAIGNATLFATGLAAMARRDLGSWAGIGFGTALLGAGLTTPYLDAMVMGNINLALAGLLAWAWAIGRGSRLLGWFAGLGGLIKLHPFALAGWTTRAGARRTIATTIVVAVVVVVATLPLVGLASWLDYGRAVANARPLCGYGIDAIACGLLPVLGGLATPALLAVTGAMVLAAIFVQLDIAAFALIVVAVLIAHPEVFGHTLLLAEVLLFAVVCAIARRRRRVATP